MAEFNLEASKSGEGNVESPAKLQQEGRDLAFTDGKVTGEPGSEVFEFDGAKFIEDNYGSEQAFMDAQPKELRKQLGLPESASSEDVFQKMAKDTASILTTASESMKTEILDNLNLKEADASEEKILEAMVKRETKAGGPGGSPSFEELENSIHQASLAQIKSGQMPIDYD